MSRMSKTITNWEDRIEYRPPSNKHDEDLILDFVNQHFIPLEPLNVSICLCEPGYRMQWFDNFVRAFIAERLSLMAFDTVTKDLVGVAICTESTKASGEAPNGEEIAEAMSPRWAQRPEKFGKIMDLLEVLVGSVDIFSKYDIEKYVELFILCTHSSIRYPGLGTALSYQIMDLVKGKGFNIMATEATSYFSQKIFARIGFDTVNTIRYEEYKPDGEILFPKYGEHDAIKFMVKAL